MPLAMNREVFITCAVTGSGGTQDRSPHVPRSPKQIADSAIDAAKAGAAIVHCHVRDPETGKPRRDVHLYREVTERIRDANVDVVLNLTAGMGGDMVFGSPEAPLPLNEKGTDMGGATNRMEHVRQCLPEIEAFDTGHLWFAKQLVEEKVLNPDALVQLCMGVPWGAPDDLNTFMAMVNNVPSTWNWSAFSIGRNQMAYAAAAVLAGGNVRVGLEDNLWLDKGVLATNAQLVERAASIVTNLGARVIGPEEVRKKLNLTKRAPIAA